MSDVLLVDAGFSARPLKRALEGGGYRVHTVGARPTDALATENPHHHLIDYSNVDALASLIDDLNPVNVIPGCTDLSYEVCSQLVDKGLIQGLESSAALRQLHNKAEFRDLCVAQNIPVPTRFNSEQEALSAACPLAVKPADAFSGKGITILPAPNPASLTSAVADARAFSRTQSVVIEQFVSGQLFSYSAFLWQGKVEQAFSVVEYGFVNPLVVDTSYVVSRASVEERLRGYTERLCSALGLTSGLFHIQYIDAESGPSLIEVTRRCPGDLYSELIQRATGFDYSARYVSSFLAEPLGMTGSMGTPAPFTVRHTLTGRVTGYLSHAEFLKPQQIRAWYPLASSGVAMSPSPGGRVGVAFLESKSVKERDQLVADISSGRFATIHYSS